MNVLRLEYRLDSAVDYLTRLKAAMTRVDAELWPQGELSQDLESLMARLNQIPGRGQEWKKSSARCDADVAFVAGPSALQGCQRRQDDGPQGCQHKEARLPVLHGHLP